VNEKKVHHTQSLVGGEIKINDIQAVTAFIKIFESFEKFGWSISERRISRNSPDVNQN
jgi:hypothetical protein